MPTPLTFTWHPNLSDMQLGLALGSWGTRGRLLRTVVLLFLLPCLAFGGIVGSFGEGVVFGVLFGGLFLVVFPPVFARMLVRNQLSRSPTIEIVVTEESVERNVAGTVIRHPWSAITRVLELPSAFLLFTGRALVGSIEKSAIPNATAVREVRALITAVRPIVVRPSTFLALERHESEA